MNSTEMTTHPRMSAQRCRRLMAATRVCRLAFVVDGRPHLVVLNHVVDGDHVVFQTSEGTTLAQLVGPDGDVPAVLETDSTASSTHTGWSVVATGRLSRTTADQVGHLPHPWRPEAVGVLLRLDVTELHGLALDNEEPVSP